jgi:hypothetical protein
MVTDAGTYRFKLSGTCCIATVIDLALCLYLTLKEWSENGKQ